MKIKILFLMLVALGLRAWAVTPEQEQMAKTLGSQEGTVAATWNKVSLHSGSAHKGRGYYEQFCMGCHGARGAGDGDQAKWVRKPMPNLMAKVTYAGKSDRDLFIIAAVGVPGTPMGPIFGALEGRDIRDLVAYLRTLESGKRIVRSRVRKNVAAKMKEFDEQQLRARSKAANEDIQRKLKGAK